MDMRESEHWALEKRAPILTNRYMLRDTFRLYCDAQVPVDGAEHHAEDDAQQYSPPLDELRLLLALSGLTQL